MANFSIPNRPAQSDTRDITLIEADFDYITGNMDSMVAARKLVGQANGFVTAGNGVGSFFMVSDGKNVGISGTPIAANSGIFWWYLDPNLVAIPGKNTVMALRCSVAVNGTAPGVNIGGKLAVVTFSGASASTITPNEGTDIVGSAANGAPGANSGNVYDSGSFNHPPAGPYAPMITVSGAPAAGSVADVTIQLFAWGV